MRATKLPRVRTILIAFVLLFCSFIVLAAILKPYILPGGRLSEEHFAVFDWLGVTLYQVSIWLAWFAKLSLSIVVILLVYWSLYAEIARTKKGARQVSDTSPLWTARLSAIDAVFGRDQYRLTRKDWIGTTVAVAFFAALFSILLSKSIIGFRDYFDSHWHMTFLDYGLNWGTPIFSFGGNVLTQFGIQPPFNTNLSPLNGLAHLAPPRYRIATGVTLFYSAAFLLLWAFGQTIRLKAVPRVVLAGVVSLIVTIPFGVDGVLPLVPPLLFTANLILTHYWLEAGILCLTGVFLFFWLGQCHGWPKNLALGIGFSLVCYDLVLVFPGATFLAVPVMLLYSATFLLTVENLRELWWKIAVGGALAISMLATHIPTFVLNLYAYCFGPYFHDTLADPGLLALLKGQSMIMEFAYNEPRIAVIFAVALGTAFVFALRSDGPLRRFAIAVLVCEFGLVLTGTGAVLIFHFPISLYYAEVIQAPFLLSFFVLYFMLLCMTLIVRLEQLLQTAVQKPDAPALMRYAAGNRLILYRSIPAVILLYAAFAVPSYGGSHHSPYPPAEPPSVKLLEDALALKPGATFRGRVFVLARPNVDVAQVSDITPLAAAVFDLTENHYGATLGNDHWTDLLPLNIPVVNESFHYTSAMNFLFLRAFFGREGDVFDKAFFMLRAYNARVARMIGVRFVVTDTANIPGGKLVYESVVGGEALRLFRIDGTNLGQYSPTRAIHIATAAEGLAALKSPTFDPQQDVIVEQDVPANLVPGTLQSLTVEDGPTLHVKATSPGISLLVLPFEYSHCLRLKETGSTARLIPVNLQQTGLLFDGSADVEIDYRFGPLANPTCRANDVARMDVLHAHDALK
jgi:hypothetical protein